MALLKIEGKTVRKVAQAEVSDLAEGIAFSPDGRYLYVGNFVDGNIDILRLDGDALTKVASFALPGHSASMRGEHPLSPPLRSPHALTRRIKSAQRSSTGSVLSAVSGSRVTTTQGAHVAVALQQIGILGAAEQRSSRRLRAGGLGLKRISDRQEAGLVFFPNPEAEQLLLGRGSVPRQSAAIVRELPILAAHVASLVK